MRLPSKVTPYSKSVISDFPLILGWLSVGPKSPKQLMGLWRKRGRKSLELFEALDCLCALRAIDFNETEGLVHRVG